MRRISIGLFSLVSSVLFTACSITEQCDPERGTHCSFDVEQLLINDVQPDDPLSGLKIDYGVVPGFNECDDPASPYTCPPGTSCSTPAGSFASKGCVDSAGRFPTARSVPTTGVVLHVVFDSLLGKVTQYACDCTATGGVCAAGHEFSLDPFVCTSCESGACLDANHDGLPDSFALVAGLATIRCGDFAYTTLETDGEYVPGGNQFPGAQTGLAGLGPALVLRPAVTLPENSDCTLELSDKVRSKADVALSKPSQPLAFHTR